MTVNETERRRGPRPLPPGPLYSAIARAGLTVGEFAAQMGYDRTSIWRFDRELMQPLDEDDFYADAAKILGCSPDDLRRHEEARCA